ncbi:MAG: 4-(cytidine 5'-diphospho)-2-C-methyl-D-erythritol kinase [Chthonomonas sp.]|nr:4-(cytidine 5'-diphospho)-2-C-methyl-D-erythritol kinase [Chthonomonas sp.]
MIRNLRCPAKVNTFLSVGQPDASGYHPIRSIFQAVGLYDTLTITSGVAQTEILCDWRGLPERNTLSKTLQLVRELVDVPPLRIELRKGIPVESGLGGGSSDAAGLLRALPQFVGELPWGHATMVAEAVGADVPFFLVGGRARAEGYGEKLTALENVPREWLVIVKPDVGVSSAQAYGQLDAKPREWRAFPVDDRELYNDFERVAPCACLEIVDRMLGLGADGALLSGSGSAVFGRFATEEEARKVAMHMAGAGNVFVAPTLSREESLWMS